VQQPGYQWVYIFTAIRPATGKDVTLVLPAVNTAAMQIFLDHVAASRPPDVHVALVLDGAGWHLSRDLTIPENITPVVLPSYSPSSTRSSASGSTSASASSPCGYSPRPTPWSTPAAQPGCASSPNPAASITLRLPLDRKGRLIDSAV
jgi:hypothetical protein